MTYEEAAIKEAVERGFLSTSRMSECFVGDWEFTTIDSTQQTWFKSRKAKEWLLMPRDPNIPTNIIPFRSRKFKR